MRTLKILSSITATISMLALSGCATSMKSDFSCNVKDGAGIGCASMSKVHQQLSTGQIPDDMPDMYATNDSLDASNASDGVQTANNNAVRSHLPSSLNLGYGGMTPQAGQPILYTETVQRIWIAPYKDLSNNYHDASFVYTIVKPSHWVNNPVEAITASGFDL